MKPLNIKEIENIVEEVGSYAGSQLQEVVVVGRTLGLGLWSQKRGKSWLVLDMKPSLPMFLPLEALPFKLKKEIKPMGLFLRSHAVGKILKKTQVVKDKGRVVRIVFEGKGGDACELEFRLFPHGQNLIVSMGKKTMSWSKVKDLGGAIQENEVSHGRDYKEIIKEWLALFEKGTPVKKENLVKKELKKKKQLLLKIENEIKKRENSSWQALGEWLSEHQSKDVPEQWRSQIEEKESFSWNLQNSFERSKKDKQKLKGLRERKDLLEGEILTLEKRGGLPERSAPSQLGKSLFEGTKSKGRRLTLSPHIEAYAGKSAKDNLKLLRNAKAWDYWLHIKDYPGCHGIVRRGRNKTVTDEEFQVVAKWLLELQWGQRGKIKKGEAFEFIIAECRYVRPIKGDKLGRVTFQNEKILRLIF